MTHPNTFRSSQLVASRSFLAMCDHKIQNPTSSDRRIPTTLPTKAGESVYIHPEALVNFVMNYLPHIRVPFVLVSGDSDITVPTDMSEIASYILRHPLLIRWYAQNCVSPSEKLKQLPIGIDFHTLEAGSYEWGPQQSIASQTEDILRLKETALERQSKCYANFQFLTVTRYANDRLDAIAKLKPELVFYEPTKLPRMQCWSNMVKHKYVISPHGNGLDCHRTWEALTLGCIPIVKTSALDPMFAGLPVLIVNDWTDVSQELLDTFVPSYERISSLWLSHWFKLIHKNVVL
jgi:hypothetical protein